MAGNKETSMPPLLSVRLVALYRCCQCLCLTPALISRDSVIFVTATLLAHNGLLAVTAPLTNGWIRSLSHSGQVLVLVCNPRLSCLACSVSRDCRDAVAPHITGFSEHNQLLSSDSHSSKEQQRASERQARVSEQLREHGRPLEGPPCPFKLRLA